LHLNPSEDESDVLHRPLVNSHEFRESDIIAL
jgi:hypothetical protein